MIFLQQWHTLIIISTYPKLQFLMWKFITYIISKFTCFYYKDCLSIEVCNCLPFCVTCINIKFSKWLSKIYLIMNFQLLLPKLLVMITVLKFNNHYKEYTYLQRFIKNHIDWYPLNSHLDLREKNFFESPTNLRYINFC